MVWNILWITLLVGGCESLKGIVTDTELSSEPTKITRLNKQVPATVNLEACERFHGKFETKEGPGPQGGFISSCMIKGSHGRNRDLNCEDVGGEPVREDTPLQPGQAPRTYCAVEIPGEPFFREMTCKDYGGRDLSYTDDGPDGETVYKCVFD